MRPRLALGLMSGTSADGVSLAVTQVRGRTLRVLAHSDEPYPAALRRRVLAACGEGSRAGVAEVCRLNADLGRFFAAAATRFLRKSRLPARRLAAAGCHGQTLLHLPAGKGSSTLQVGEPAFLAEALGVPVVADFRPRDLAAGGQGAPLAPFLDQWLFGDGPPRILQNIGGVANAALVGRGLRAVGFDTGPGNSLIDIAARRASGGRLQYDKDGALARRGKIDEGLAARLAAAPYFRRPAPKSLDRSAFGEDFFRRHFGRLAPADAAATATYLTALTIADACRRFLPARVRVREMLVSGGGALNPVLMSRLGWLLAPLPVRSSAAAGLAPTAKEPALIALMALLAVEGKINHCPEATGARGARILGKLLPGTPT